MTLHLDLLRHGETQAGPGFIGSTDTPLSERGLQQMRAAVALNDGRAELEGAQFDFAPIAFGGAIKAYAPDRGVSLLVVWEVWE